MQKKAISSLLHHTVICAVFYRLDGNIQSPKFETTTSFLKRRSVPYLVLYILSTSLNITEHIVSPAVCVYCPGGNPTGRPCQCVGEGRGGSQKRKNSFCILLYN